MLPFLSRFYRVYSWQTLYLVTCALAYLPFLNARLIRTAGDEKVYISQALEMEKQGFWFIQRLLDQPDYYKGPLDLILIRIGFLLFGHCPFATLYMNWILLVLGGLALGSLVARRLPHWKEGPLWTSLFFSLNVGSYTHVFCSQMEVPLMGLFAIGLFLLDQLKHSQAGFLLWSIIGFIGLWKAPLHSVLAGISVLLFWITQAELWERLKNKKTWLAIFLGISICGIGYLPAALFDWDGFYKTYLLKELAHRQGNGHLWYTPLVGFFGFYLFPWIGLSLISYLQTLLHLPLFLRDPPLKRLFFLCLAWILPSLLFFSSITYRCENYNLPVISALILWISVAWQSRPPSWKKADAIGFASTGLCFFLALCLLASLSSWLFNGLPDQWSPLIQTLCFGGVSLSLVSLFTFMKKKSMIWIAICLGSFYLTAGSFLKAFGEKELVDLQQAIQLYQPTQISYWNTRKHIWNEWGILNLWFSVPIRSLHSEELLKEAIAAKDLLLLSGNDASFDQFKNFMEKEFPHIHYSTLPWKRWGTQGRDAQGNYHWKEAFEKRDLSVLEVEFKIIYLE